MTETMRAIIKPDAGPGLEMVEVPVPRPGPQEALVRITATSICGTDLHIFKWDPWARENVRPPVIVGHEFCGTVAAVGSEVTGFREGDYVSAESHVVCHTCPQCRTGQEHTCPNARIIGVHRDGCWADYVVVPAENLWRNPPDLAPEIACMQENFGNAVHTALRTTLTARRVLITGCGPVGLMCVAVARAAGARSVFATDISPYRLMLAREVGAHRAYNVAECDVVREIMAVTGGEGVDVLLELSGAAAAIDQGFRVLRPGGEAALLGLFSGAIPFDLNNHVIFKGATVYGIVGRRLWETWEQMRGLLEQGSVDLRPVVTHCYPLVEFQEALRVMSSGHSGKVVLFPDTNNLPTDCGPMPRGGKHGG